VLTLGVMGDKLNDADELVQMAGEEDDEATVESVRTDLAGLEKQVADREFRLMFSGEMDANNSFLDIQSGSGGTDAQDFCEILLRMYLRWAEQQGFQTEMLDSLRGQEAGFKSVTVGVYGAYAYGYLKAERGVHRLVRLSPFDEAHRRHTSFVLVEVVPDIADDVEIEINLDDVKVDVFKASGAGGQHVQKNSTAVRLTHLPTGIVVSCQNERSQTQNKDVAFKILRGKLYDMEQQRMAEEQARLKGKHVSAGWGNQIRSYVLHPYHMVKDLRTDYETGNTTAVLDGHIQEFIEAYLQSTIGE